MKVPARRRPASSKSPGWDAPRSHGWMRPWTWPGCDEQVGDTEKRLRKEKNWEERGEPHPVQRPGGQKKLGVSRRQRFQ